MDLPKIDIVIPTYNRAQLLGDSLRTLICQETAGKFTYEIVVVDNMSTDNTRDVVEQIGAESSVAVHYLYCDVPGDAPPRNHAIAKTSGRWLAFFDDDQLTAPDCLWRLFEEAEASGASIVGGAVQLHLPPEVLDRLGPFVRRNSFREIDFQRGVHRFSGKHLPGGANVLVARNVFEAVGIFDTTLLLGGSDRDFFHRARLAGFEIRYTPDAVIRHCISPERTTLDYLRWDAQQGCGAMAHYDFKFRGRAVMVASCAARIGHGLLVLLPGLAGASLAEARGPRLDYEVRLWRVVGYARKTLALLA
ncbi:MAG TPA: glycosyltransferase, partial [Pirellulales bacterium]|nr:glycosyltransferase [Pirellulales bacterium]